MLATIVAEMTVGLLVSAAAAWAASTDNRSPLVWAVITVVLCVGSSVIPLPVVRVILAGYAAFLAMFVRNLIRLPPI
jgi:hypothetical protein